MRIVIAAFTAAISLSALAAPVAPAAPTKVNVRIEGKTETLFEGPVLTDGHNVRAAESDSKAPASGRPCDGTNGGRHPTPGPTPTVASVDAMSILGEDFDGQWYPGFDDYFVKRWGPDAEDEGHGEYWGLLVNDVFANVGGCQYQLDGGDEVLWVYDAFDGRPNLALFPEEAAYASGPRPLTATAQLGEPFPLEVVTYEDDLESVPPATPARSGSGPYEGAEVAPVLTNGEGFEKVDTSDPATKTTDSEGKVTVAFDTAGWHRIKATVAGAGGESVIRSNRIDVCVAATGSPPPAVEPPLEGASSCGELPAADAVREAGEELPTEDDSSAGGPVGGSPVVPAGASPGAGPLRDPVRVTVPKLDRSDLTHGRVGVSWRVLSAGVGIERWRISSQTLGRRGAPYVSRATGSKGTAATLRLPPGASYRLRFTVVDVLGRSSAIALGKVVVPPAGRRP
jgi:hypothetical protein